MEQTTLVAGEGRQKDANSGQDKNRTEPNRTEPHRTKKHERKETTPKNHTKAEQHLHCASTLTWRYNSAAYFFSVKNVTTNSTKTQESGKHKAGAVPCLPFFVLGRSRGCIVQRNTSKAETIQKQNW